MGLINHVTNYMAHVAQESGHKSIAGMIDAANANSEDRYVRQCAQDRRFERAWRQGQPSLRLLHQQDE